MSIQKPKMGEPCNHCGLCCQIELCGVASLMLGDDAKAPCDYLVNDNGEYLCGVVLTEQLFKLEPLTKKVLGIGLGCSMPDGETTEQEVYDFDRACKARLKEVER